MKKREPIKPEEELALVLRLRGEGMTQGAINSRVHALWADRLTQALQGHLEALAERTRKNEKYGDEVADALGRWAKEARIENLAEWLKKTGWSAIESNTDYVDQLEAAIVEAWKLWHEARNGEDREGEPIDFITTKDGGLALVYLCRTREDPLPDADSLSWWLDHAEHAFTRKVVAALDGMKGLFSDAAYSILCHALIDDRWLYLLAYLWVLERADDEAERKKRREGAVPMAIRPKATTANGDQWTCFARPLGMPAALAGPLSVEVDGMTYAHEPDMAACALGQSLRPRGMEIIPSEWLGNPAQLYLNLDLHEPAEALREYMVETAARTAHLANLPNLCPKMLGFMFAAAPMTGRGVQGTLGELARWMYPDWKENRRSTRDLRGVGAAFVAIEGLRLVETEADGARRPYKLFIPDYGYTAKADARLGWMINPWLAQRMQGGKGGGFFLMNMTGWLTMKIENPRLFLLYLRMATQWDKARVGGEYNPARLQWINVDDLARECNAMPALAQRPTRAGKAQLHDVRGKVEAYLDDLAGQGMAGRWEKKKIHGKGFQVLPVPPDEYAEACRKAADAARRKKRGA